MNAITKILFLFTSLPIYSCKDEYTICDLPKEVILKTGFYEKIPGGERQAIAPSFSLSLLGSRDFIYKNSPNVSRFNIPLSPLADSVKFMMSIAQSSPTDTITLVYSTQNVHLSAICGDVYVHTLTKVFTTINTLDSIKISIREVNTTSGENVKIYF